jgi:hypothetical protein
MKLENEVTNECLKEKPKVLMCDILLCYSVNQYIEFDIILSNFIY